MTSLLCGTLAGVSSYFTINQIAKLSGVDAGKSIEAFSGLVFDTGGSLLSEVTEMIITEIAPNRLDSYKVSGMSVKTRNTKARNSRLYCRTGCKAPAGKVSSDYYYFMLYGTIR